MENIKKRLIFSFVINILLIVFFIICIIINIININNNPNSLYQNVWGLFRYFTIDGNLVSWVFTIIIWSKQIQALKLPKDGNIREKIVTHFLYIISLISACNDIIIFIVVVLVFLPLSNKAWIKSLIGSFGSATLHIVIPVLIIFRFLFLDIKERDLKIYEKIYGAFPMIAYGIIMYILCGAKAFTSFDKREGDGRIPYPFFDVYHQPWYFCLFVALFIIVFGFFISVLFDFLNKKSYNLIFPCEKLQMIEEALVCDDDQRIFPDSNDDKEQNKN